MSTTITEIEQAARQRYEGIMLRTLNELGASALTDLIEGLELAEPTHPALLHLKAAREAFKSWRSV